jgi:hypothetical protein
MFKLEVKTLLQVSTQPLYVIDGIPVSSDEIGSGVDGVGQQSRMNDINPNDIESVKYLKELLQLHWDTEP